MANTEQKKLLYKSLKRNLTQKAIVAADPATTALVYTKDEVNSIVDTINKTTTNLNNKIETNKNNFDSLIKGQTPVEGLVIYRQEITDNNGIAITENKDSNLAIYKVNQDGSPFDVKLLLNNKEVVTKDKIDNLVNTDIVTTALTIKGSNLTSTIDSAGDTLRVNGKLLASLSGEQRFTGSIKTPTLSIQNSLTFMNASGDTDVCSINYVDVANSLRFFFPGVPNKVYTLNNSGTPTLDTDLTTKKYVDDEISSARNFIKLVTGEKALSFGSGWEPHISTLTLDNDDIANSARNNTLIVQVEGKEGALLVLRSIDVSGSTVNCNLHLLNGVEGVSATAKVFYKIFYW